MRSCLRSSTAEYTEVNLESRACTASHPLPSRKPFNLVVLQPTKNGWIYWWTKVFAASTGSYRVNGLFLNNMNDHLYFLSLRELLLCPMGVSELARRRWAKSLKIYLLMIFSDQLGTFLFRIMPDYVAKCLKKKKNNGKSYIQHDDRLVSPAKN